MRRCNSVTSIHPATQTLPSKTARSNASVSTSRLSLRATPPPVANYLSASRDKTLHQLRRRASSTFHRLATTRGAPAYIKPRVSPTNPSPLNLFAECRLAGAQHHQVGAEFQIVDFVKAQKTILRLARFIHQREHDAGQLRMFAVEQAMRREMYDAILRRSALVAVSRLARNRAPSGLPRRSDGENSLGFKTREG